MRLAFPLLLLLCCLNIEHIQAQLIPRDSSSSELQTPKWPEDSLKRRSPRGTVSGFIQAVADENYTRAAQYLNVDRKLRRKRNKEKLAAGLQQLLDQYGSIMPYALISDKADGSVNDNLGPNIDRVGSVSLDGQDFDIMVESTLDEHGGPIWLFSAETMERIPLTLEKDAATPLLNKVLPSIMIEKKWGGVPIGHWLVSLFLIFLAYCVAWLAAKAMLWFIPLVWRQARNEPIAGFLKAFSLPIQLFLGVWCFIYATQQADISIVVRQRLSSLSVIFYLLAFLLLIWQLLEAGGRVTQRRLAKKGNQAGVSAVLFLQRAAKIAMVVLGIMAILDTIGFNVTAGIAALGIGGIALALGAQKTVENFVGSVTLIADQPVRVGDFCKVGTVVGTVEQIGMRSTQIRTNARTIVTIPNGEFSSLQIENFSHRDKFFFNPYYRIRLNTTPDQMRYLLIEMRAVLYAHPKVLTDPARVRFVEVGSDALKLEIFAYINAVDFNQFLEVQEDLYLHLMAVVKNSGTALALPSQTIYVGKDPEVSEDVARAISSDIQERIDRNDLQIPSFDQEDIERLNNEIPYPPVGSSFYKNKS